MTEAKLFDAIGGINDRYIMEFAYVKPKRPAVLWRWIALAACIGVIVTASMLWPAAPSDDVKPTISMKDVIWGKDSLGDMSLDVFDHVSAGEIYISEGLSAAFARSSDDGDVFAVRVIEVTGATREEIYENFIKTLALQEDYLSKGVIFATQQQVKTIVCPEKYGFVFSLASKTEEPILITENYLQTTDEVRIPVVMYIRSTRVPEKDLLPDVQRIEAEYLAVMKTIVAEYRIPDEQVKSFVPSQCAIYAELDKDTLLKLLKDDRIFCLWHSDSIEEGFDLSN